MMARNPAVDALRETLATAVRSMDLAAEGHAGDSAAMFQQAAIAADGAFPRGSAQANALALVLATVRGGASS